MEVFVEQPLTLYGSDNGEPPNTSPIPCEFLLWLSEGSFIRFSRFIRLKLKGNSELCLEYNHFLTNLLTNLSSNGMES